MIDPVVGMIIELKRRDTSGTVISLIRRNEVANKYLSGPIHRNVSVQAVQLKCLTMGEMLYKITVNHEWKTPNGTSYSLSLNDFLLHVMINMVANPFPGTCYNLNEIKYCLRFGNKQLRVVGKVKFSP